MTPAGPRTLTAEDIKSLVKHHHNCADGCGCNCGRSYTEKWEPIISRFGRNAPECKCKPAPVPVVEPREPVTFVQAGISVTIHRECMFCGELFPQPIPTNWTSVCRSQKNYLLPDTVGNKHHAFMYWDRNMFIEAKPDAAAPPQVPSPEHVKVDELAKILFEAYWYGCGMQWQMSDYQGTWRRVAWAALSAIRGGEARQPTAEDWKQAKEFARGDS